MTRRVRLTLLTVLLVTGLVTGISLLYLNSQIDRQFTNALSRGDLLTALSADAVVRSLDSEPFLPVADALAKDTELLERLMKILTNSGSLLEIAVCDADGRILLSTDPVRRRGALFPRELGDYRALVETGSALDKARILFESNTRYYQLAKGLGAEGDTQALAWVRLVIYPALIRMDLQPDLERAVTLSLASVVISALLVLVFSGYAFKPLGQVSEMLDRIARGDYAAGERAAGRRDEFNAVFSKVDLLGQQLGNVDRLLDQLEEAVVVFGAEGATVVASGALEKFLGKRRADLLPLRRTEIFPPATPIGFVVEQAVESDKPVRNLRVPVSGGSAPFAMVSVEILERAAGGARRPAGLLVRLRDPDVRRQIQGQLETAERLSAISRVTRGVAHEVKNPLNAILMHVDLARLKLQRGDTSLEDQMGIIEKEILRLDRVVKTFLDFARPAELRFAEVPVDALLRDLADLTRPQAAAAHITVEADLAAGEAVISADADLLKQTLLNLVVNAVEAMPDGGQLRFSSRLDGDDVVLAISDTGAGIPPEARDRIFQLYFTTKPGGSGIGLALAYRTIQMHGARMDFSTETGKGTTFYIRFPLGQAA